MFLTLAHAKAIAGAIRAAWAKATDPKTGTDTTSAEQISLNEMIVPFRSIASQPQPLCGALRFQPTVTAMVIGQFLLVLENLAIELVDQRINSRIHVGTGGISEKLAF